MIWPFGKPRAEQQLRQDLEVMRQEHKSAAAMADYWQDQFHRSEAAMAKKEVQLETIMGWLLHVIADMEAAAMITHAKMPQAWAKALRGAITEAAVVSPTKWVEMDTAGALNWLAGDDSGKFSEGDKGVLRRAAAFIVTSQARIRQLTLNLEIVKSARYAAEARAPKVDVENWFREKGLVCPDCNHTAFRDGPQGGMGMNCMCGNCKSAFNIAGANGRIFFAERIPNNYWMKTT